MLLDFFTILIMLIVAYVYFGEGIFTAFLMFVNLFVAGLVAFNFWEPLASILEPMFSGTPVAGYEDILCLILLFCPTLAAMRTLTNTLAKSQLQFSPAVQSGGGLLFGLATGYLATGFLLCALQTLPWHENFMFFDPKYEPGMEAGFRRFMPPDRVWLALMYRAGAFPLSTSDEDTRGGDSFYDRAWTFDKFGSFELRYARYRRHPDRGEPLLYQGELQEEVRGPD
jgi:Colicin V production protein